MYKVYPDDFDFVTYEDKYKKAFEIRYKKDNSINKHDIKLLALYTEFSNFLKLNETIKIKSKVSCFPNKFEDLLVLKPEQICEIYLQFTKLTKQEQDNINNIKFEYDDFKSRIFSFFLRNMDKLNFNTCFYCDMTFINYYKALDKNKKLVTKKQFDLDHFIPKQHCKIFALSLYNLVPSCSNCNSGSKGSHFYYTCSTATELATTFPTSTTYDWINNMKFKIFPRNYDAIADLIYSENYQNFGIELDPSNNLFEEESKTFEIIPKYEFFMKQFVNQIDKYRMYDKNFFNLITQKLPIGTASFLYESIFNNELRDSNQLPFKKIYKDIKEIFEN